MVGRTPEYQGKKLETKEMRWVSAAILIPSGLTLICSSLVTLSPHALDSLYNKGPHALTELLYAFTSPAANNGSAFAGFNSNTPFYHLSLGTIMIIARLAILIPSVALGGILASKPKIPSSQGTLSTTTTLFLCLLIGVILIVGALTFFPLLLLGPILEQFLMLRGAAF